MDEPWFDSWLIPHGQGQCQVSCELSGLLAVLRIMMSTKAEHLRFNLRLHLVNIQDWSASMIELLITISI